MYLLFYVSGIAALPCACQLPASRLTLGPLKCTLKNHLKLRAFLYQEHYLPTLINLFKNSLKPESLKIRDQQCDCPKVVFQTIFGHSRSGLNKTSFTVYKQIKASSF